MKQGAYPQFYTYWPYKHPWKGCGGKACTWSSGLLPVCPIDVLNDGIQNAFIKVTVTLHWEGPQMYWRLRLELKNYFDTLDKWSELLEGIWTRPAGQWALKHLLKGKLRLLNTKETRGFWTQRCITFKQALSHTLLETERVHRGSAALSWPWCSSLL